MTGYTVHTGTSKKFTEGWDNVFTNQKSAGKKSGKKKEAGKKSATAKAKPAAKKKKNDNG